MTLIDQWSSIVSALNILPCILLGGHLFWTLKALILLVFFEC